MYTAAIGFTFVGQVLLSMDPDSRLLSTAPFFPYGIWVSLLLFIATIPILTFKGKHLRLLQDRLLSMCSDDSDESNTTA